jgi:hypothetical protein
MTVADGWTATEGVAVADAVMVVVAVEDGAEVAGETMSGGAVLVGVRVLVAGTRVTVAVGTGVLVAGTAVKVVVAGTGVRVGGTGVRVAVGGTGVRVGVLVGGASVRVGVRDGVRVAVGRLAPSVGGWMTMRPTANNATSTGTKRSSRMRIENELPTIP